MEDRPQDRPEDRPHDRRYVRPYSGVFPIASTPFLENEDLDLPGQRRVVDFLVDAGVAGICILANFSEQFSLTDDERNLLTDVVLEHAAGRVPIIVTTSHFSARVVVERSRRAERAGAAMVMVMPPYHGASLRADPDAIRGFFLDVAAAVTVPVIIQDAPLSGTPMPTAFLASLANEADNLRYFKIETAQAAAKLRALIELGGAAIEGPFGGEEAISLLPELDAGATGTMPGSTIPEVLVEVVRRYRAGDRDGATSLWEMHLPLINYENKHCGLQAAKILMAAGGIIESAAVRRPLTPVRTEIRERLLEIARRLNVLVLTWQSTVS